MFMSQQLRSMVECTVSAHQNFNNAMGVSSAVVGYVAMALGSAVSVSDWLERKRWNEIELMTYLKKNCHFSKKNQDALAEILDISHSNEGTMMAANGNWPPSAASLCCCTACHFEHG